MSYSAKWQIREDVPILIVRMGVFLLCFFGSDSVKKKKKKFFSIVLCSNNDKLFIQKVGDVTILILKTGFCVGRQQEV
jgi:hypothetical protein